MRSILPDSTLDALRTIGDPELTPSRRRSKELPAAALVSGERTRLDSMFPKAVIAAATPAAPPIDLDDDRLEEAQHLFAAYGTEIGGALILAALPQSYATAWGSRVLWANSRLQHDLVRRIKGTARFVLAVAQRGDGAQGRLWDPRWEPVTGGLAAHPHPPWQECVELRLYHQAIRERLIDERERERVSLAARRKALAADGGEVDDDLFKSDVDPLGEHNEVPLNQEDLLGMLLSLSITTFEVLERYGISWTADQQESYLHMWDVVGAYLGIGVAPVVDELAKRVAKVPGRRGQPPLPPELSWVGLRPVGVSDTRRLLGQLRDRQWLELGPFANDDGPEVLPGRVLTKALVDELNLAMPHAMQRLPLAVMRALSPDIVRRRLNLGGGGVLMRTIEQLPRRRVVVGRFTRVSVPSPYGARILRALGNDVSARVITRFLHDEDFEIPGLVSALPP